MMKIFGKVLVCGLPCRHPACVEGSCHAHNVKKGVDGNEYVTGISMGELQPIVFKNRIDYECLYVLPGLVHAGHTVAVLEHAQDTGKDCRY